MKSTLVHSALAGGAAAGAALLYSRLYAFALDVDFSLVTGTAILIVANMLACLMASLAYYRLQQRGARVEVWFNLLFTVITFASLLGPLMAELPPQVEAPELFLGLAIPLHLFPQLFWLTVKPLVLPMAGVSAHCPA